MEFLYAGEVPFGPACHQVKLDGRIIKNKIFGNYHLWSSDNSYLALQEWLTSENKIGPNTSLFIIDVLMKRGSIISNASQGYIKPVKFEGDKIIYIKEYFDPSKVIEYEFKLNDIKGWTKL